MPAQDDDVPFVLKVEDAFWVTGRGTAILGVIEQGVLHIGDHLEVIQPGSAGTAPLRCKCLHVDPVPRVTGRDPALGYPIGILIGADIEPDAIRPVPSCEPSRTKRRDDSCRRSWRPDLSRLSHGLAGRSRTRADGLDIRWTLTCSYGLCRTGRTYGIDLRIKRLGG